MTKPRVFFLGVLVGAVGLFLILSQVFNWGVQSASGGAGLSPSIVFERIQKENELVCASQDYTIVDKATDTNKIPFTNISIPLTENSYWCRYCGTIKVSVKLDTATYDQTSENSMTITLDQPVPSSNTPDMERSGVLEENNNILNPIHIEDVDAFRAECVKRSEEEIAEGGIYDEAKSNAEENLKTMFKAAMGEDFELTIAWRDATSN